MSSDTPPSIPPRGQSGSDSGKPGSTAPKSGTPAAQGSTAAPKTGAPATGPSKPAGPARVSTTAAPASAPARPSTSGAGTATATQEAVRPAPRTGAAPRTTAAPAAPAGGAPVKDRPASEAPAKAAPRPAASGPIAAGTGPRRVRLAISRIDPWSVMKLSFLVSVAIGIMIVVASAVVWLTLDSLEVFARLDGLITEILADSDFDIMKYVEFDRVISVSTLIAVVDVFLITALATIGAFLYNIVAALVGGVHVTMTDD